MADIVLHTYDNQTVTAFDDAILYDFLAGGKTGFYREPIVSRKSTNTVHIEECHGLIRGRSFTIPTQDITVSTAGRSGAELVATLDLANTSEPISLEVKASTAGAQDENANYSRGVYTLPVAHITIVSNEVTAVTVFSTAIMPTLESDISTAVENGQYSYRKNVINEDYGDYVAEWKFNNGLLIATASHYFSTAVTTSWGSIYYAYVGGFGSWLTPFVDVPSVTSGLTTGNPHNNTTNGAGSGWLLTTENYVDTRKSAPSFYLARPASSSLMNGVVTVMAIGRWK